MDTHPDAKSREWRENDDCYWAWNYSPTRDKYWISTRNGDTVLGPLLDEFVAKKMVREHNQIIEALMFLVQ